MIDYINNHLAGFWIAAGFLLLALEALVFGFSTIVLLFGGIGALTTGLLMTVGVLPETWVAGISAFGISTGMAGVLLWKPFKSLQNRRGEAVRPRSDLEGLEFHLEQPLRRNQPGRHRYSGIDWTVEIDDCCPLDELEPGCKVRVMTVEVGRFSVCPVDQVAPAEHYSGRSACR